MKLLYASLPLLLLAPADDLPAGGGSDAGAADSAAPSDETPPAPADGDAVSSADAEPAQPLAHEERKQILRDAIDRLIAGAEQRKALREQVTAFEDRVGVLQTEIKALQEQIANTNDPDRSLIENLTNELQQKSQALVEKTAEYNKLLGETAELDGLLLQLRDAGVDNGPAVE